jgi:predicted ATPase/class 3 adenylate cyclase
VRLPTGTVTLVFTDVEGSTRMLQELGTEVYVRALEDHRRLLRETFAARGGVEVEMQGDSFFFAFADAAEALAAAAEAQRALAEHSWETEPVRVRMGVHSGEPVVSGELYAGLDVHRAARVMSAGHGGQVLVSEATRVLLGGELELRDLGDHRLKDLLAPVRLFQLGAGEFPPVKSLYRTNLPVPATPFLGRLRELAELAALLAGGETRLLTLTGPGGTGKTRLAVQAAAESAELYPDGIVWVDLAPLRDPALVASAIAQAVEARGELAEHIGERRMLLVLDNFEQLVDAAPEVGSLLSACPNLTVIATSRETLRIAAEREYPVRPLQDGDAVALFHERARASGTELGDDAAVGEICRRLDRLPLAIELAAARLRILQPAALLERLEERLALLEGGPRDRPERQRTLRATIAWSYDLLDEDERTLFARLAVFGGGCTLAAATDVCDAELGTLQSLVEKSLVRQSGGRFWMLETIRMYAAEKLDASVRERHARFFLELAERRHGELRGPRAAELLKTFDEELANFRRALEFLLETGAATEAVRLAGALSRWWMTRGHLVEGTQWLERTVAAAAADPARARALQGLTIIALERGDIDGAEKVAEEALSAARETGDRTDSAEALLGSADVAACKGDLDRAELLWREVEELTRRDGLRLQLAIALYNLGQVARHREQLDLAQERFEEAYAEFSELEDVRGQAGGLFGLVDVATERGELDGARSMLARATELMARSGYVAGVLDAVELAAGLADRAGEPETAARLFGARHALSEQIGRIQSHPLEAAAQDAAIGHVRSTLGDDAFVRAWEAGAAMTLDDVVELSVQRPAAAAREST